HRPLERLHQARTGAPGDVEAGHGVAVAGRGAVAALGPPHDREEPDPQLVQPGPFLPRGPLHVGPRPPTGPQVLPRRSLDPVEAGAALPVLPREVDRVVDPHPPLLRAVDEEEPSEAPPRLTPQMLRRLLVHEQ